MSKPKCLNCSKKPARKDDRFCSNNCGWSYAIGNTVDYQWHVCVEDWADSSSSECEGCQKKGE